MGFCIATQLPTKIFERKRQKFLSLEPYLLYVLLMKKKTHITKTKPIFSHDSFFKHFYADPKLAQELLQLIFSKKEQKACILDKVKVEKDTFEQKRADLVFSVPFRAFPKNRLELFILLEHKSHYDKNTFEQLLDYQILIRKDLIQQKNSPRPIIPLLFSHGKDPQKWKKSLQEEDFKELFLKIPIEIRKDMLNYRLRVISAQDPKIQKACKSKRFKSWAVIKLLSEIWDINRPTPFKVKEIFLDFKDILDDLKGERRKDTVLKILEYLFDNTGLDEQTWKKAEVLLIEEGLLTRGGIMDIREHIREKGRWEGRQEGRLEGRQEGRQEGRLEGQQKRNREVILNMLKEKADISFISKVMGLSEKEIKKLKNGS